MAPGDFRPSGAKCLLQVYEEINRSGAKFKSTRIWLQESFAPNGAQVYSGWLVAINISLLWSEN